ncbi:MAG: MoaD/ThiS family protein [Acidimicrobiia bacterium]
MTVRVRLPTILRSLADGEALVRAEGQTVGEVFADLEQRHPGLGDRLVDQGDLHRFVNVFVGDEDIRYLQGLDTPVPEGAEISILPAVAGG